MGYPCRLAALLVAVAWGWGCTPSGHGEVATKATPRISFEAFAGATPMDPASGMYVADGDMLMTRAQLADYYSLLYPREDALIVYTQYGQDSKWDDTTKLDLSYCVSEDFKTPTDNPAYPTYYDYIVEFFARAASDWNTAANIRLWHNADEDARCNQTGGGAPAVVFRILKTTGTENSFVGPLGKPVSAPGTMYLKPYSPVAVMRHELGHVLGFMHEHVRYPGTNCAESFDYRPLTALDTASIMYGPGCTGFTGDPSWGDSRVLTELDKLGAASLYGCPGALSMCSACVDMSSDESNCGACGNVCDAGCNGGVCGVVCAPGYTESAGVCTNAPPNTPMTPEASAQSTSSILVTWQPSPSATTYTLQRGLTPIKSYQSYYWTTIDTATQYESAFVDSGLAGSTTFSYRISACNVYGCSAYSGIATARTLDAVCSHSLDFSASPSYCSTYCDDMCSDYAETGACLDRGRICCCN